MAGQKVQRSSAVNAKQPMVVWSGALEMDRSKLDPFSALSLGLLLQYIAVYAFAKRK